MRPGAVKIGCQINHKELMATAVKNPYVTIAPVIFNPTQIEKSIEIIINDRKVYLSIHANALQTVEIN